MERCSSQAEAFDKLLTQTLAMSANREKVADGLESEVAAPFVTQCKADLDVLSRVRLSVVCC